MASYVRWRRTPVHENITYADLELGLTHAQAMRFNAREKICDFAAVITHPRTKKYAAVALGAVVGGVLARRSGADVLEMFGSALGFASSTALARYIIRKEKSSLIAFPSLVGVGAAAIPAVVNFSVSFIYPMSSLDCLAAASVFGGYVYLLVVTPVALVHDVYMSVKKWAFRSD